MDGMLTSCFYYLASVFVALLAKMAKKGEQM
jgi:hypothetical protein